MSSLEPDRAPSRIADVRTTGGPGGAGSIPVSLEKLVFGEAILSQVEDLRELVAEERWIQAFRMLATLRFGLQRIDRALAVRRRVRSTCQSFIRRALELPGDVESGRELHQGLGTVTHRPELEPAAGDDLGGPARGLRDSREVLAEVSRGS